MMADTRRIEDDPIAVQILWERCISIVDEAADKLVRAAFSTVARESNDFGCVLCDADGVGVGYTTRGTPRMGIILPRTIRAMLETIAADELQPGDVIFSNDPWFGSGHLPDFYVAMPIFVGKRIVGFAGACSHASDVGGSIAPDTRDVYEEGICFPPVKLYRAGVRDSVIFRIIEKNVRVPDQVVGDLDALVSSCHASAKQLVALMQEIGIDDLRPLSKTLAERTERVFRNAVASLPDGVYESSIESDGYNSPVRLCCSIRVDGTNIEVDCEGTSPQVSPGAINVVYNFTYSAFVYALKCILDPHTPYNEGITRAVSVRVPPRTILNAEHPAPVFARNQTAHYLPALVMAAIAKAAPERVMAACGSPTNRTVFAGRHGHDGKPFSFMMISSGGMGACIDKDGHSCTPYPSNSGSPPVEVLETVVPLRVHRKALRVDSGGAGTFRGGLGVELIVENASAETMQVASRMDRVTNPPEGLAGGHPGSVAGIWQNESKPFPPKGRGQLAPTETLAIHSPGGGGYGEPSKRDRMRVEGDVREGLISPQSAERIYRWRGD